MPGLAIPPGLQHPDFDVKRADVLAAAADVGFGCELPFLPDRHHLTRKNQSADASAASPGRAADTDRSRGCVSSRSTRAQMVERSSTVRIAVPAITHSPTSRFLLTTAPPIGARILRVASTGPVVAAPLALAAATAPRSLFQLVKLSRRASARRSRLAQTASRSRFIVISALRSVGLAFSEIRRAPSRVGF